jgi:hypothetical protein
MSKLLITDPAFKNKVGYEEQTPDDKTYGYPLRERHMDKQLVRKNIPN